VCHCVFSGCFCFDKSLILSPTTLPHSTPPHHQHFQTFILPHCLQLINRWVTQVRCPNFSPGRVLPVLHPSTLMQTGVARCFRILLRWPTRVRYPSIWGFHLMPRLQRSARIRMVSPISLTFRPAAIQASRAQFNLSPHHRNSCSIISWDVNAIPVWWKRFKPIYFRRQRRAMTCGLSSNRRQAKKFTRCLGKLPG